MVQTRLWLKMVPKKTPLLTGHTWNDVHTLLDRPQRHHVQPGPLPPRKLQLNVWLAVLLCVANRLLPLITVNEAQLPLSCHQPLNPPLSHYSLAL